MEFGLLGPLLVRRGDAVVPVRAGKQRTVLATLLLNANHIVPTEDLVEALWGTAPPPSARVSVQNYVAQLRKALGDQSHSRIGTQPRGYVISVADGELDIARFEVLLGAARQAARDSAWDTAAAQARAALALWRGEPLADVESELLAVREVPRLAELRLQALQTRIDADLHLGRHAEVIGELQLLAVAHPLREHLHALLMLALYRDGRQAEALAAYQARPPGAAARNSAPSPVRNCGSCISRSLPPTPPWSAATLVARGGREPGHTAGTPPRRVAFHRPGRRADCADQAAGRAGAGPGTVVISAIGGTAGVGKTALAVHWAHQVADRFPDGQLYVNLRGFDPSGTPATTAGGDPRVPGRPGRAARAHPASPEAQAGLYRSLLADRRMLIVLDNARDEQQVRPLLPASPGSLVLVTSRNQLSGLAAADGARLLTLDVLQPRRGGAPADRPARHRPRRRRARRGRPDRQSVRVPAAGAGGRRRPRRRPARVPAGRPGRRAARRGRPAGRPGRR